MAETLRYTPVRSGRPRGSRRLPQAATAHFIGIWDPEDMVVQQRYFLIQNLQFALRETRQSPGARSTEDDFGLRLLTAEDLPRLDVIGLMEIVPCSSALAAAARSRRRRHPERH